MIIRLTNKIQLILDLLKLNSSKALLASLSFMGFNGNGHVNPTIVPVQQLDLAALDHSLRTLANAQAAGENIVTVGTRGVINTPPNTPNGFNLGNFNINGPLDQFNVTELVGLKFEILGKFYLAITNISLYLALVLVVIIAIFYFGDNDSKLVPNKWSIVLETFFASIKGMVKDQIGLAYEIYLPLIFSIFFFFLTGNLISNIPYSFAANASGVVSIGYSLTFFIGVTITSLFNHGNKFFRNFIPQGTPLALVPLLVSIEFTSYTARGFSLGVRMFANLFSGHCLLAILSVFGTQLIGIN